MFAPWVGVHLWASLDKKLYTFWLPMASFFTAITAFSYEIPWVNFLPEIGYLNNLCSMYFSAKVQDLEC
jgi:hypothetical protein